MVWVVSKVPSSPNPGFCDLCCSFLSVSTSPLGPSGDGSLWGLWDHCSSPFGSAGGSRSIFKHSLCLFLLPQELRAGGSQGGGPCSICSARLDAEPGARLGVLRALQQCLLPKPGRWHLESPGQTKPGSSSEKNPAPVPWGQSCTLGHLLAGPAAVTSSAQPSPATSSPQDPGEWISTPRPAGTGAFLLGGQAEGAGTAQPEGETAQRDFSMWPSAFVRTWRDGTRGMASHCQWAWLDGEILPCEGGEALAQAGTSSTGPGCFKPHPALNIPGTGQSQHWG